MRRIPVRLGTAFGRVCQSVCQSVCNDLTFESLDLESSFLCASTSTEISGQVHTSRSSGKGQGHRSKKSCLRFSSWL